MPATLVGFLAVLLWSSLALLTTASGPIPPFGLAALTFGVGGLLGLCMLALRGRLAALRQPWTVWSVGVAGLFGYHALYFAALQAAPPAQAGLIAYLWPLLIVLLSAALPGERLAVRHVAGALLGFGGVALLIVGPDKGQSGFDARFLPGYALALCCAFVWSGYSVLSRRMRAVPTEAIAGFCAATAILAAIAHALLETPLPPPSAGSVLAILGLGIGPVGIAFYVWDFGVKRGDIRILGILSYMAPVLSTMLLVICGYAQATLSLGLACGLIVFGAIVGSLPTARQMTSPQSAVGNRVVKPDPTYRR